MEFLKRASSNNISSVTWKEVEPWHTQLFHMSGYIRSFLLWQLSKGRCMRICQYKNCKYASFKIIFSHYTRCGSSPQLHEHSECRSRRIRSPHDRASSRPIWDTVSKQNKNIKIINILYRGPVTIYKSLIWMYSCNTEIIRSNNPIIFLCLV